MYIAYMDVRRSLALCYADSTEYMLYIAKFDSSVLFRFDPYGPIALVRDKGKIDNHNHVKSEPFRLRTVQACAGRPV